jgi:hypothetical protein
MQPVPVFWRKLIRQPGVIALLIANYQDGGLGDWMARAAALGEEGRPAIGMPQADVEYFGDFAIVIISHGHGSFMVVVTDELRLQLKKATRTAASTAARNNKATSTSIQNSARFTNKTANNLAHNVRIAAHPRQHAVGLFPPRRGRGLDAIYLAGKFRAAALDTSEDLSSNLFIPGSA